jgi:hypothetical protein
MGKPCLYVRDIPAGRQATSYCSLKFVLFYFRCAYGSLTATEICVAEVREELIVVEWFSVIGK